jgi:membrane fusion protein, heavy metal efflux system
MEKDNEMNREENNERSGASPNEVEDGEAGSRVPSSRSRLIHVVRRKPWLFVIVVLLVISAVALTLLLRPGSSNQAGRPVPAPTGLPVSTPSVETQGETQPRPGDITITLAPNELENAQIKTEVATTQAVGSGVSGDGPRTTGTVQSNTYKEVAVLPIAGGITREVNAQLGDKVKRGQPLATIFSTELANAQSDYLKMAAELEEHHKHHQRAIELVEIGAMSREELEGAISKYKAAQASVASERQRLMLLGMSQREIDALRTSDQVRSLITVPAPASGTVITRSVNPGEVIATGKELFRVADLSNIWVVGQVYESDFAKVHVGTPALITTAAYPGRAFSGRISYIDPRVDPQTRTAQVRIELANPSEILKIGMFVDVSFGGAAQAGASGQPGVLVSRSAVQSIGTKQVVFVATDRPGVFVQREVSVGPETNGLVTIYSGVNSGERVVTEGSFLVRAESLKLNPGQSTSSNIQRAQAPSEPPHGGSAQTHQPTGELGGDTMPQAVTVAVTKDGFTPASFTVRKNIPVRLTFIRKVEVTCATDVVIPDYDIKRELPMNEPVIVEFTPEKAGTISFACGMNMQHGKIVVK